VRIGSRFAAADPGNSDAQRDLAATYQRLAAIHHRQGKSTQALAELRQGRDIMATLRRRAPEAEQWREELGYLEDRIAALEGRRLLTAESAPPAAPSIASTTASLGAGAPEALPAPAELGRMPKL
jgi:hypothetical protein